MTLSNKVVRVAALADGWLHVELHDGRCGDFDAKPYMTSEFFAELQNEAYFQQVGLFFDGVGWPGGQDLGPDTVSAFLKVTEGVGQ